MDHFISFHGGKREASVLGCGHSTFLCWKNTTLNATISLIMLRITITSWDIGGSERSRWENCWLVWRITTLFLFLVERWATQLRKLPTLLQMKQHSLQSHIQQVCEEMFAQGGRNCVSWEVAGFCQNQPDKKHCGRKDFRAYWRDLCCIFRLQLMRAQTLQMLLSWPYSYGRWWDLGLTEDFIKLVKITDTVMEILYFVKRDVNWSLTQECSM